MLRLRLICTEPIEKLNHRIVRRKLIRLMEKSVIGTVAVVPDPKPKDPPKETKPAREKKDTRVKPPKLPKLDKVAKTSKAPAIVVLGAGALMGGTGIMLRSKAVKIYNDEYSDEPRNLDLLEKARKPNRQAHINDNLRSHKTDKPDIRRVQITPQIEYNAISNTNAIHAKMTYRF